MRRLPLRCLMILLAMLPGPSAIAARMETVAILPQAVPGSRMPTQPIPAILELPDGKGPFPAVIVLHGCGGRSSSQQIWAGRLNGWGYAALIPDSFAPRDVFGGGVCPADRQHLVTYQDRAGDVLSAGVWLRTRPDIDGGRIGVLGVSHGGGTAAWVTQRRYEQLYPGLLKASVDYYGACRAAETHGTVPLLALAGDDDTWGFPALSCRGFAGKLQPNQVFEVHTYPGAVHDFDNPQMPFRGSNQGHPTGYDHDAAEDSFVRVKTFLDRYVGHAGS
jgi:dienelactone hydrolase